MRIIIFPRMGVNIMSLSFKTNTLKNIEQLELPVLHVTEYVLTHPCWD